MSNELALVPDMPVMELGTVLARSGYFNDARDAAQAVVKVLAGRELGFGPVASMTGFYIVKGRVSMSANLMGAAVKRSGKYNYRVLKHDESMCAIEFFEKASISTGDQWQSLGVSQFTIEDARKAGTQNLDKFPRNMLFARAMSNGVKWYCPDVTGGPIYTPDELGEVVDGETGEIIKPRVYEQSPATTAKPITDRPIPLSPDNGHEWTTETACAVTTQKGTPLGKLSPEQLDLVISKTNDKNIKSAALYLREYLREHETQPEAANGNAA